MANSKKGKKEIVFPQDILSQIFSFLPTKSVGKCRCLTKEWHTLLSSRAFIKAHLQRQPKQQNLVLIAPSGSIHTISDIKDHTVSREVESTFTCTEFVGSVDGLVLFVNGSQKMLLMNPTTLEQLEVADGPLDLERSGMYGFGYYRERDDYKIVRLSSSCDTDDEDELDKWNNIIDVYSMRMGVWRRVNCGSDYNFYFELPYGATVNGAIHWLATRRRLPEPSSCVIIAFDLAEEAFKEIPTPSGVDMGNFEYINLMVFRGCLCMMYGENEGQTDVWIMDEYGSGESWTRLFTIGADDDDDARHIYKPLYSISNEEVLLVTEDRSLVLYNPEDGTSKDMVVDGVPARFRDGGTYVESLVSPAPVGA